MALKQGGSAAPELLRYADSHSNSSASSGRELESETDENFDRQRFSLIDASGNNYYDANNNISGINFKSVEYSLESNNDFVKYLNESRILPRSDEIDGIVNDGTNVKLLNVHQNKNSIVLIITEEF